MATLECNCGNKFDVVDDPEILQHPCPKCGKQVLVPAIDDGLAEMLDASGNAMIRFKCACGYTIKGPKSWEGRRGKCPKCGAAVVMPTFDVPRELPHAPWPRFKCACGLIIKGPHDWMGRKGACPGCGARVVMPTAGSSELLPKTTGNKPSDPPSGLMSLTLLREPDTEPEPEQDFEPEPADSPTASRVKRKITRPLRGPKKPDMTIEDLDSKKPLRIAILCGILAVGVILIFVQHPEWFGGMGNLFASKPDALISLESAVKEHNIEQVKANLERGEDVNKPTTRGLSLVAAAAMLGDVDTIDLLVKHGAEVTVVDKEGKTPLHLAAASGRLEVVRYLLAHGADINAGDKKGVTPLAEANTFGHKAVSDFLSQQNATSQPTPTAATAPAPSK